MYKIMTAGPTQVRENVRMARSLETTNPDLDVAFCEFYKETCDILQELLHSSGTAYILGGEGILGLEAACASLTEPGDRVLVIDNGIFGKGFADFVKIYGGEPVLYTSDYREPVNPDDLRAFLEKDSDYKYATVVHCDTPSGVLNDVSVICPMLAEYGILSVVDSVAGMFGEYVNVDQVANLYVYGGHVDDIIVNENGRVGYADGHSGYAYIFVSDAEVGNITVGGQNGKTGSFSQLVLDCSNMTSYANLTMGYCDGMLLSDRLNDEDSTIIMSVTIFGEKLNGIDAFKELPYCTVNNGSIVKFHAGKGEFDNGDKIYNYTTSLFDEEGNPLYID